MLLLQKASWSWHLQHDMLGLSEARLAQALHSSRPWVWGVEVSTSTLHLSHLTRHSGQSRGLSNQCKGEEEG